MLTSTDETPNQDILENFNNSAIFTPRAKNLLDYATENQEHSLGLQISTKLYHSESKETRKELCKSLLMSFENALNRYTKDKEDHFIPLCILYMASKSSQSAGQPLTRDNMSSVTLPNNSQSKTTQQKIMELLFALLPANNTIHLFHSIGEIVGLKYDSTRISKTREDLMDFVERCLFKVEDPGLKVLKGPLNINNLCLILE